MPKLPHPSLLISDEALNGCSHIHESRNATTGQYLCWLIEDHDGPCWDAVDGLWWTPPTTETPDNVIPLEDHR